MSETSNSLGYWISPKGIPWNVPDSHVKTGDEIVRKELGMEESPSFTCYEVLFEHGYVRIISRAYNFTVDAERLPNELQINAIMAIIRKEHPYEVQIIVGNNPSIFIEGGRFNSIRQALLGKGKSKSKIYDIRNNPNYF